MKHGLVILITAGSLLLSVTGCAAGTGSTKTVPGRKSQYSYTKLPSSFSKVTADGVTVHRLASERRGTEVWSPSGSEFAFAVNPQKGTAVLGTTSPLHMSHVNLGNGRTIVALTSKYAVVTSASATRDWLYPIKGKGTSLGQPIQWTAPTDTWQEWVDTVKGAAIVTGGYKPGSIALTFSDGSVIHLHGGEVTTSLDHKFGAVASRVRMKRVVHPVGDESMPSKYQPSPAASPITVWNFDSAKGPEKLTTIQLPLAQLPTAMRKGELQSVEFSPNNSYVAVLIQGKLQKGPKLLGKTFVFATRSGRLVGTAPYGNGMQWSSDSKFLWLGTPMPGGQGSDRVVNIHGHTVWNWPDSMNRNVVIPISGNKLLVAYHNQLDIWNKKTGLTSLKGLRNLHGGAIASLAPGGTKALIDLWNPVVYATW